VILHDVMFLFVYICVSVCLSVSVLLWTNKRLHSGLLCTQRGDYKNRSRTFVDLILAKGVGGRYFHWDDDYVVCVWTRRYYTELSDDLREQVRPSCLRFSPDGAQLHPRLVSAGPTRSHTFRSALRVSSQHGNATL